MATDENFEKQLADKATSDLKKTDTGAFNKAVDQHYLTFVSIVFGVFISVWIQPIVKSVSDQLSIGKSVSKTVVSFDLNGLEEHPILLYVPKNLAGIEEEIKEKKPNLNRISIREDVASWLRKSQDNSIWMVISSIFTEKSWDEIKRFKSTINKEKNNVDDKDFRKFFKSNYTSYLLQSQSPQFQIFSNTENENEAINFHKNLFLKPFIVYAPKSFEKKAKLSLFHKNFDLRIEAVRDLEVNDPPKELTNNIPDIRSSPHSTETIDPNEFLKKEYVAYIMYRDSNVQTAWRKISSFSGGINWEKVTQGSLMFLILICLWWWYGLFLGSYAPANSFGWYAYDFISLGTFAMAFRFWDHILLYPLTVLLAQFLIFLRFSRLYKMLQSENQKHPENNTGKERKALLFGLACVGLYSIFAITVIGTTAAYSSLEPSVLGYGVMLFHMFAIAATIYAARTVPIVVSARNA